LAGRFELEFFPTSPGRFELFVNGELWFRALGGTTPFTPHMIVHILEQDDGQGAAVLRLELPGHDSVRFRLARTILDDKGLAYCLRQIEHYEDLSHFEFEFFSLPISI
jgi:hypothetical protein